MTRLTRTDASPAEAGPAKEKGVAGWSSHPFLEGLSAEHFSILAECAMPTSFDAGQVVFRQGELASRFYLILEGRVVLEAEIQGRAPVKVDLVAAGEVLGWSWIFPPYLWNFSARAIEPVRAIFFYGTWLRERCATDPAFGYELMRRTAAVVVRRLQAARQELIQLAASQPAA